MTKKPSYRFEGYTESWVEKKLGEVGEIQTGNTPPTNEEDNYEKNGFPWVTPTDINSLVLHTTSKQLSEVGKSKARIAKSGSILVTCIASIGKNTLVRTDSAFNQQINSLTPSEKYSSYFLLTQSEMWSRYMLSVAGAGTMQIINKSDFSNIKTIVPSLPEQTAIGSFFQDIDQFISLQQRKLEVLKEQKKTYLKLLFPAKGQTKPALRFAGFEDEWKEVKLGEYCDIATGKLDANAMVTDGEYDFYTSGIQKYKIDVAAFEGPAITIAGNGATVGYMHYADGKFNAYQRTYVLSNFLVDRSFIYSEIGRKLPSKIKQEARTGNIPYIVMDMLTKLDICLPSLPEQEAIGSFFQDLDKSIAKQEEKVNQLKESKQTLLRKMFI